MTTSSTITDASMQIPSSRPNQAPSQPVPATSTNGEPQPDALEPPPVPPKDGAGEGETVGHAEHGRTIAVHSVCVLPTHQHLGLGKTVLKAYIQRMETSGMADRIAILSHPELVGWYTGNFGFQDKGESKVQFGGGGWRELVCPLFIPESRLNRCLLITLLGTGVRHCRPRAWSLMVTDASAREAAF